MDDFHECVIGSFDDEVEALVQYGHDCCARIDDRIHECCGRIKDAHNVEVDAYKIALGWKREQSTLVTYDVLGNERHKVICELRKLKFEGEGIDYDGSVPPTVKMYDVTKLLSAVCKLVDDWPNSLAKVRDTLIHLLGGDAKHVSLHAGDGNHGADNKGEVLTPITQELRDYMEAYKPFENDGQMVVSRIGTIGYEGFLIKCDAIDAIHASLERENEELRQRTMYPAESERINMLEREMMRLTAECKTQRNNFDQATSAREHWKKLYEQSLEHVHDLEHEIHDLEHDVEVWRDRAEDMRMERDDALKEHHAWAPESHYIMLPKDSDGTPVHVGDVMEWPDGGTFDVIGIGADNTVFYVDDGEMCADWTSAGDKRRHEPSVKDVLREVVTLCHNTWNEDSAHRFYDVDDVMESGNISDFAAKLQLRGDAE